MNKNRKIKSSICNTTEPTIIAAIDETVVHHGGGVTYVLAGVVFLDSYSARQAFRQLLAHRKRPFHWRKEGSTIRAAAVELLETHIAATHLLARSAARHQQVAVRRRLLNHLVAGLINDGIDHLIIESQGNDLDRRDRDTVMDAIKSKDPGPALTYEWLTKTEPLLWYADALNGVAQEYLADGEMHHFQRLQGAKIVTQVQYVTD
ncbi:MAG: hypothetical protein F4Z36_01325 [Acidimicrobiia bacterium]|nr:hypothetical protein [bacterium]MXX63721.1 hypothetical protein [Acidimicrobiia bacterium]MYH54751.1 hypothetical protein [Acidimicrobiia bacterium]